MSESQNITKRCTKCGADKPLGDYYAEKRGRFGRMSACKRCVCARNEAWKRANPEKVREMHRRSRLRRREMLRVQRRKRYAENREHELALMKRYRELHPEVFRDLNRRWRKRHSGDSVYEQQILARRAVTRAIAAGVLVPEPCAVCGLKPRRVNGKNRIEAHHHNGYGEKHWLDVQWLCIDDHRAADAALRHEGGTP